MTDPDADSLDLLAPHLAEPAGAYLVGGRVRDHLLGRRTHDTDVVVPAGAAELARLAARSSGGAFVRLDGRRDIARIVWPSGATLDVAAMAGGSIEADLARRDFTVNAMAVPLSAAGEWLAAPPGEAVSPVIDPTGGLVDLRRRQIRTATDRVLLDDPLRLLRAPRFAAELDFGIAGDTAVQVRSVAPHLRMVAAERIQEELLRTLRAAGAAWTARTYAELALDTPMRARLWPALAPGVPRSVPAFPPSSLDLLDRIVDGTAVNPLSDVMPLGPTGISAPEVAGLFDRWPRGVWLRLAALLEYWQGSATADFPASGRQSVGAQTSGVQTTGSQTANLLATSPQPAGALSAALGYLALGGHAARFVSLSVDAIPVVAWLAEPSNISRRDVFRYLDHFGEAGLGGVVLHAAQAGVSGPRRSTTLADLTQAMWIEFFDPATRRSPLVDGSQVIAELAIPPGPAVGTLLSALREAQACGEIETPEDALNLARTLQSSGRRLSPEDRPPRRPRPPRPPRQLRRPRSPAVDAPR